MTTPDSTARSDSALQGVGPVTAAAFIYAMADRYVEQTSPPMPRDAAIIMAVATLAEREREDGPFGSQEFSWDAEGAREIADEDMSYWEKG